MQMDAVADSTQQLFESLSTVTHGGQHTAAAVDVDGRVSRALYALSTCAIDDLSRSGSVVHVNGVQQNP